MPIYNYKCNVCGKIFDALVFPNYPASCPRCHSGDLHKLPTAAAVFGNYTEKFYGR